MSSPTIDAPSGSVDPAVDVVACSVPVIEVAVRTTRVHAFSRRLAWCNGIVAVANTVGVEDAGAEFLRGDYVNVCMEIEQTEAVGDDMRRHTKAMAQIFGDYTLRPGEEVPMMLVRLRCERRETERNRRGAVVLHATAYLGVERTARPGIEDELDDPRCHQEKGQRHAIFAAFLQDTLGGERLVAGGGVLEVAAGKGELSRELCGVCGEGLRCTLVEPAPRKQRAIDREETDALADSCRWITEEFNTDEFVARHQELLDNCSAIVGLHPDQPTEAIVDCALRLNKPFAVVPCCVYPGLFPERRLDTGQGVVTYGGLLRYLRAKDPRIRSTRLPFQGRNVVLYVPPEAFI